MNKDMALLRTVEVAAIAAYKYIGKKDKNAIDSAAIEAMELMLQNTPNIKLTVINSEGELDNAPMLYSNQVLGDIHNPHAIELDMSVDPIEGTNPAAYNFAGAITCIVVSEKNTQLKLPEMYMEKFFVASYLVEHVDFSNGIIATVKKIQTQLNKKDLKAIILDKPRHREVIKQLDELGVIVRLIQDGDVLAAIDVVNGAADFVYGIGGAPEGVLMGGLAISTGCKMWWTLKKYDKIYPNEVETQQRLKHESEWIDTNKININQIKDEADLINDRNARFFAAGVTAGGTLKPIDFKDAKFHVSAFMSTHGIARNIDSIYNVNQINNLKPSIKYIFEKYKR